MIAFIKIANQEFQVDLSQPLDISLPFSANPDSTRAWYLDPMLIEPVRTERFTGSVKEGGSVNFRNISFNPHGHGTHTECVGHISEEVYSINQNLKNYFGLTALVSVSPEELQEDEAWMKAGDKVIQPDFLDIIPKDYPIDSLIIRTTPNKEDKKSIDYSSSNPPFLHEDTMKAIVAKGIKHLLIDLPSVDKELDDGKLRCHHLFWEHPINTRLDRTITELIYVPSVIRDGIYLLELQVAPFENDASPSRPLLYRLII